MIFRKPQVQNGKGKGSKAELIKLREENRLLRLEVGRLRRLLLQKTNMTMRDYLGTRTDTVFSASDPSLIPIADVVATVTTPRGRPGNTPRPKRLVGLKGNAKNALDLKIPEGSSNRLKPTSNGQKCINEEVDIPSSPGGHSSSALTRNSVAGSASKILPPPSETSSLSTMRTLMLDAAPSTEEDITWQMEMVIQADMDRRLSGYSAYNRRRSTPQLRLKGIHKAKKVLGILPSKVEETIAKKRIRFPPEVDLSDIKVPLTDKAQLGDILNNSFGRSSLRQFLELERSEENLNFYDESEKFCQESDGEVHELFQKMQGFIETVRTDLSDNKLTPGIRNLKTCADAEDLGQVIDSTRRVKREIQKEISKCKKGRTKFMSERECRMVCNCLSIESYVDFPILVVVYRVSGHSNTDKMWQLKVSLKRKGRPTQSIKTKQSKERTDSPEWNSGLRFADARYEDHLELFLQQRHNILASGAVGYARVELQELRKSPIIHLGLPLYKSRALKIRTKRSVHLSVLIDPAQIALKSDQPRNVGQADSVGTSKSDLGKGPSSRRGSLKQSSRRGSLKSSRRGSLKSSSRRGSAEPQQHHQVQAAIATSAATTEGNDDEPEQQ